jgi:glycosyltransferase involved in cell wall biosynthesis
MKKKLLFVIPNLNVGGAEKSLVNLLNALDYQEYAVDLMLIRGGEGVLLSQIPNTVRLLSLEKKYQVFERTTRFPESYFLFRGRIDLALSRILCRITLATTKNIGRAEQYAWKYTKRFHSKLAGEYDVAIAFLEKSSIYYVTDFVTAKYKFGFIHSDYAKLDLDVSFDLPYFKNMDGIAAVSPGCVQSLQGCFPCIANQFHLVPNVIPAELIRSLAEAPISEVPSSPLLLSIGRLIPIKGFDLALEAAALLVARGVDFVWYILGDGPERAVLQQLIAKHSLEHKVFLLGMKENPYAYMKSATIVLQTSRYEGKSMVLDEAKLLHKPIIATNFSTVLDQLVPSQTGIVVAMEPESIATAIANLLDDTELQATLIRNLSEAEVGALAEIDVFYRFIGF